MSFIVHGQEGFNRNQGGIWRQKEVSLGFHHMYHSYKNTKTILKAVTKQKTYKYLKGLTYICLSIISLKMFRNTRHNASKLHEISLCDIRDNFSIFNIIRKHRDTNR